MSRVIVLLIRIYQIVAPRALRDRCIFEERCSDFVIRSAKENGVIGAFAAFRQRIRTCRPGYLILEPTNDFEGIGNPVVLSDGSVVDRSELSCRAFE